MPLVIYFHSLKLILLGNGQAAHRWAGHGSRFMARSCTSEEAARLERTHRALLAQIDTALDSSPNYEQEIANELSALLYSGQLADEIARDL